MSQSGSGGTGHRQAAKAQTLRPDEGQRLTILTDKVRVLADGDATGGAAFIFETTVPPGSGPPLHRHASDDEYFYILAGRFKFVMDGRTFIAEPGAFVAAPKGSVHTFVNLGQAEGRMLLVTTPAGLEGPFRAISGGVQPPTPALLTEVFGRAGIEFVGPPLSADEG
jgi:quercetin dioxygenase-like cupin family protein